MKIYLKPQIRDEERLIYEFEESIIRVTHNGKIDTFDFTDFPDGELELQDDEGEWLIETDLDYQPIRRAKKVNGELHIVLMNFVKENASEEERFPEWIDHEDYVPPVEEEDLEEEEGEEDGEDEVEE